MAWWAAFKASNTHKDEVELVFVSSDRTEEVFKEYHGEMNFHALPYDLREEKVMTMLLVDACMHSLPIDRRS